MSVEALTRNRYAARSMPWLRWLVLALGAFAVMYPIGLFLINSLKTNAEFAVAPLAWPKVWAWENYLEAWDKANPGPKATLSMVADHIDHLRKVAGIDHIGIGGDFDGIESVVEGLGDVSTYPALFAELLKRGYSEGDVQKIAGRNVLRVMRGAEAVAQRLQKARPPSLATIDALDGGMKK
jgi:ABC-type maltose transport system permease subunit